MARSIHPLKPSNIPELSRFLTTGFKTPPDADYAAPEVLYWKYLEDFKLGTDDCGQADVGSPFSYLAFDESEQIIGHLGLCASHFEGRVIKANSGRAPTIHIIDWLGSPAHRAIGLSLMRKAHETVATQFSLGASEIAMAVGERIGYELRSLVPMYIRVLRNSYWLRLSGLSSVSRGLLLVRGIGGQWIHRPAAARASIRLEPVGQFGAEIEPVVEKAKEHAVLTHRDPARLNTMLRFPRQKMTGWHLVDFTGRLCGLAVLNIVPTDHGRTRTGKIVDCLLDDIAVAPWHAALMALFQELARQGADLVQAYASTPWMVEALRQSGAKSRFTVRFLVRDPQALIPHGAIFHLTALEGDNAYT